MLPHLDCGIVFEVHACVKAHRITGGDAGYVHTPLAECSTVNLQQMMGEPALTASMSGAHQEYNQMWPCPLASVAGILR